MINVSIVDDNNAYRDSLILILNRYKDIRMMGHALNGCDYILKAFEKKPDIVLVNVKLNTYEAICTLKLSRQLFPDIKLIAITFLNEVEGIDILKDAGFNAIITRDSQPREIIWTIRQVYENRNFLIHKNNLNNML